MKTNIANRIKSYYETSDFKSNYSECLIESFANNKGDILTRIQEIVNNEYYFEKKYGFNKYLSIDAIRKIYNYISENIDLFITDFNGYYVGYTSLDSVEFGEQEEQLTGIYNHNTGEQYDIKYLRKIFAKNDYYVKGDYAYYIVIGGIHIDMLHSDIPIELFNE